MTAHTRGAASVSVPVLSNTMVSASAMASKCLEPLTVKPSRAAWLMAERTAMAPVSFKAHE